jgi:mRNA-degrading endonuclease YafQ of YafQ-DinJ toxin-antitoxin module
MRVVLAEALQKDVRGLSEIHRLSVFDAMLSLPRVLGDPHAHAGLGVRKLHPSGIWEARVGLGLRLVFAIESERLTLVRVGTHDEIRRHLRQL